jgi:hypothetical protein
MFSSRSERKAAMKKTAVTLLFLTSIGIGYAAHSVMPTAESHARSPLSIAVNGQNGTTFRLVHTANNGWGFADRSGAKLASASPQQELAGAIQALPAEPLQNVIVDGPTGYVFAYVLDEGWRFLGNVADTKR